MRSSTLPSSSEDALDVGTRLNDSPIRVLTVIPGDGEATSMVFAQRESAALREAGVVGRTFYLSSRTSVHRIREEQRRYRAVIEEFQPHLIHNHYGTVTACFSVFSTRLPVVVTYHGSDLNPCPSIGWARSAAGRFLSQLAALRASRIICVSEQLKRRLWWNQSRVIVVPCGVDTRVFRPMPRARAREALGWPTKEPIVLFNAGKAPVVKRQDLAEAAVLAAKTQQEDIRLEILNGQVDPARIPLFMNAADCLLITSDWEGSPTVVKEAMACNLPVVSVDVGDVRERLKAVEPTRIVGRDSKELAKAILDVLSLGQRSNGCASVYEVSSDYTTQRVLEVYEEVLCRQ
jgi:teichuronic acid biosynthesis glycosyltransferase TuaC